MIEEEGFAGEKELKEWLGKAKAFVKRFPRLRAKKPQGDGYWGPRSIKRGEKSTEDLPPSSLSFNCNGLESLSLHQFLRCFLAQIKGLQVGIEKSLFRRAGNDLLHNVFVHSRCTAADERPQHDHVEG